MIGLLRHVSWRHLRRTALRTVLVLASVTLAVALGVCVHESTGAAAAALTRAVVDTAGRAQLQVAGLDAGGLEESLLEAVRTVPGVARAAAVIQVHARVAGRPGQTVLVTALDLLDGAALDLYDARLADGALEDPLVFVARADSIAVSEELARRSALATGSTLALMTSQGRRDFVVRGVLTGGARGLGAGPTALMGLDAAARAFRSAGRIDRIDVALDAAADTDAVAAALRRVAGAGARVERPATRGAAVDRMLVSFRLMTVFLSLVALAAAGFLVFGVTATSVAQRRREIAVLRALGATRGQVVGLFVGEAALAGGLASFAGVGAGVWAARALPGALARLVEAAFLARLDVGLPAFRPHALALQFLVGVAAVVAAALLAARQAAAVPVLAALRALPPVETARRGTRRRLALAASSAALSVGAVAAQRRSAVFLVGGTADLLVVLAAFLAAPALVTTLAPRLIGPARRLGGIPAELALRNLARQGERLAAPVIVLAIGLHLAITVGAIAASFERSVLGWLAQGARIDLLVTSSGRLMHRSAARLDEAVGAEIAAVPGVAEVRPLRERPVPFRGAEVTLRAWPLAEPPAAADVGRFTFVEGDARRAVGRLATGPAALVSENLAARFRLGVGDTVDLPAPDGPARFEVAGVIVDYESPVGTVVVGAGQYRRLWHDSLVDAFAVGLAPGAAAEATRERLLERLGPRFDLVALTMADRLEDARALIQRAFLPLRAIEGVTLVIAMLALLCTLLVSVVERIRELGCLRASGASASQVAAMIMLEALATSAIAALLGTALGAYGSHGWIRVHVPAATGWIVQYVFPLGTCLAAGAAALALAALAGAYPARAAARMSVVDALRVE